MNCKETTKCIHDHLDGTLTAEEAKRMKAHLDACPGCAGLLRQMEKAEAMVRVLGQVACPQDVKDKIMRSLPPERRRDEWKRWLKRHPAILVATVLIILMASSVFSAWNSNSTLVVKGKGSDLDAELIIIGKRVIVPAETQVNGDLIVENGDLQIEGKVFGNVTIVDGTLQASTANISGKVTRVNQAIDWIWYKVGEWFAFSQ